MYMHMNMYICMCVYMCVATMYIRVNLKKKTTFYTIEFSLCSTLCFLWCAVHTHNVMLVLMNVSVFALHFIHVCSTFAIRSRFMYLEVPRCKGDGLRWTQRKWAESAGSWSVG